MSQNKSSANHNPEEQLRHDEYLEEMGASRMNKTHGGELVEAISVEDLVLMNDPNCTHDVMVRDPSETIGIAFVCKNPKCGIVKIISNIEE